MEGPNHQCFLCMGTCIGLELSEEASNDVCAIGGQPGRGIDGLGRSYVAFQCKKLGFMWFIWVAIDLHI